MNYDRMEERFLRLLRAHGVRVNECIRDALTDLIDLIEDEQLELKDEDDWGDEEDEEDLDGFQRYG